MKEDEPDHFLNTARQAGRELRFYHADNGKMVFIILYRLNMFL